MALGDGMLARRRHSAGELSDFIAVRWMSGGDGGLKIQMQHPKLLEEGGVEMNREGFRHLDEREREQIAIGLAWMTGRYTRLLIVLITVIVSSLV